MILVTGSSGKTGKAIVKALTDRGQKLRALVHHDSQMPSIRSLGVDDVAVGDLLDVATLENAVKGARAIYHMAPNVSAEELQMGLNIIRAAKKSGVDHFIYHSVLHPHLESMPHHWWKARVEEAVIQSGLPYTILQPTVYMQNMMAGLENIKKGKYVIPYSAETRISLVDLDDVAESAAIVLTQASHQFETIELVGTQAYTQLEVADRLGRQLGYKVSVEVLPMDTWENNSRKAGMGEYAIDTLKKMFLYYQTFGFAGNVNAMTNLLGRSPTTLDTFFQRTMGA